MTVVVAFLCTDGVVIAADSMSASGMDGMPVTHHTGKKLEVLNGQQIFAFSGDSGLGARFGIEADSFHATIAQMARPIDYPLQLSRLMLEQFELTGITGNEIQLNSVLAYAHGGEHHCCLFEGSKIQPRLLTKDNFYGSLGSGRLLVDPFLRFLVDVFCQGGAPNMRTGVLLATWAIEHLIQTNPGGVACPIRVAGLRRNEQGVFVGHELPKAVIDDQIEIITGLYRSLRNWEQNLPFGGTAAGDVLPPPEKEEE